MIRVIRRVFRIPRTASTDYMFHVSTTLAHMAQSCTCITLKVISAVLPL